MQKKQPRKAVVSMTGTAPEPKPAAKKSGLVIKLDIPQQELSNSELRRGRITEYIVPENEQLDTVHIEAEQVEFTSTGEKKSRAMILKFNTRTWDKWRKNCRAQGFNYVRFIWAPVEVNQEVLEVGGTLIEGKRN